MRLWIAEKPELAKAIVEGLGGGSRKDGYYDCGDDYVTWCFGHMLSLFDPEDYDEKYAMWDLEHLPMSFIPWKLKPNPSSEKQLNIIIQLLKDSSSCVNAADADAAGQCLIDEILEYVDYKNYVERVLINDLNVNIVRAAIDNLTPNSDYKGLYLAELSRMVCDQLYGYNMTRAYTLAAQARGYNGVLSLGRVQTPILGLVVRRDLEFEAHTKSFYYDISADFSFKGISIPAKYQVKESDPLDDKKRIVEKNFASTIKEIEGQQSTIVSAKTSEKTTAPPLPFNLLKLQAEASRKFGYKPDQVKDITQALREKYKLITYNRSDCQYLSDEHHVNAPSVLAAISSTVTTFQRVIESTDTTIKSKAFNSSKVSAHHAIIPTEATADFEKLTDPEQKIYMLIARAYIAQFFPKYKYNQTNIEIDCLGHTFTCRSNVSTVAGWKSLYKNDIENEEVANNDGLEGLDFSSLSSSDVGACTNFSAKEKETKPQPRYTMDTLLNDLTRVAKYIKDPKLKAALIERDKGKEGEHGGIGTAATRDSIVSGLFEREFLLEKGKQIISSTQAREFYSIIPDQAKYPDMTAIWHQQQMQIENGTLDHIEFIKGLVNYVGKQIEHLKINGITGLNIKAYGCPECGKILRRIKGTKGYFWGCSAFKEGCKTALPDQNNKPVINPTAKRKKTTKSTK